MTSRGRSDEHYVIDLCDRVLELKSARQHRFDFLRGDPGKRGACHRLPVDAYYPKLNLVIEYYERQHSEPVRFFDRKQTVSGMSRGEQRAHYDQRRREVLPMYGLQLVEIDYSQLEHKPGSKRLLRNEVQDLAVLSRLLAKEKALQ